MFLSFWFNSVCFQSLQRGKTKNVVMKVLFLKKQFKSSCGSCLFWDAVLAGSEGSVWGSGEPLKAACSARWGGVCETHIAPASGNSSGNLWFCTASDSSL